MRRGFLVLHVCWMLLGALYVGYLLEHRDGLLWGSGLPVGRDFNVFWAAAQAAADGHHMDIFNRVEFWQLRQRLLGVEFPFMGAWLYPPHYLLLLSPIGFVPYLVGYALFTGGTLALYLGTAWRLGLRSLDLRSPGLAALVTAPTTLIAVEFGHNGFLTAALLVPGVMLLQRRPNLAGVLFGVLTFKPTIGLLVIVALVAVRAWRTTAVAIAVAAALGAVSTLLYGVDAWVMLVREPMGDQVDIMTAENPMNVIAMVSVLTRAGELLDGSPLAYVAQGVATLVSAVITYRVFRVSDDPATRALVVALGTCLATPYLFIYDLPMLSLAVALYVRGRDLRLRDQALLIAAWFLPLIAVFAPLWAAPAVVAATLWQVWRRTEPARTEEPQVVGSYEKPHFALK